MLYLRKNNLLQNFLAEAWQSWKVFSTFQVNLIMSWGIQIFKAIVLSSVWYLLATQNGLDTERALQLALYPFLAFVFPFSELKGTLQSDITSGRIAEKLVLPRSLFSGYIWELLSKGFYLWIFSISISVAGLVLSNLSGAILWERLPVSMLFMIFGIVILSLERLVVESTAFWIHDSFSVNHIHNSLRIILSGSLIPPYLFSESAQKIIHNTPHAIGYATPLRFLSDPNFGVNVPQSVGLAICYIFLLFWLLSRIQKKARNRIFVNGG